MKILKFFSLAIILLVIGLSLLLNYLTIYIPIDKVGVLTREYAVFGEKGVAPEDFKSGWHLDLGPLHTWNLFESTIQTLEMTKEAHRGDRQGQDDIKVQSADGYAVSVDATLKYRILKDSAHKVYEDSGAGDKYKVLVRNQAEKACQDMFGQMKTEDFYNPASRREKAEQVKNLLRESLGENYVEIIDMLIRNVQFDPEYEKKIQRKKLADQEVELNKSLGEAEKMKGKTQVIEAESKKLLSIIREEKKAELVRREAEANRQITKIRADFEKYATKKMADADLIAAQMEAEGNLEVRQAEAQGEKLRNQAMSGDGGGTIVALEAAKNLNFGDMTISTMNVDVLDLDKMATKLGAPEVQKKK